HYNDYTQVETAVTALANGGFVVSWSSWAQDGQNYGVFTRLFDSSGNAVSGDVQVNTTTSGYQDHSSIAAMDDGGFAVV
ncbi:hypothetical protein, partial [Gilvimarinus sp. 1_MG-2023]|uniref:hypothetical protein n=1 Tax=Gilvimarinus sp. 1_MG-2023 TaxID=3062638 RepID=UPI0026E23B2F